MTGAEKKGGLADKRSPCSLHLISQHQKATANLGAHRGSVHRGKLTDCGDSGLRFIHSANSYCSSPATSFVRDYNSTSSQARNSIIDSAAQSMSGIGPIIISNWRVKNLEKIRHGSFPYRPTMHQAADGQYNSISLHFSPRIISDPTSQTRCKLGSAGSMLTYLSRPTSNSIGTMANSG